MTLALKQNSAPPSSTEGTCPRGCGVILVGDEEPKCPLCGYVDYFRVRTRTRPLNVVSSGTRFVVRYLGSLPTMKNLTVQVRVVAPAREYPRYVLNCPFQDCGEKMLRAGDLLYWRCRQSHRVRLVTNGRLEVVGWR